MDNGMYIGVTGIMTHLRRQDVTANNLANINTPGYKSSRAINTDLQHGGVEISSMGRMMSQGALQHTGNPRDLAIVGNGFFAVRDSQGTEHFTRNGSFHLDANGRMADVNGNLVQGWPEGATSTAGAAGDIQLRSGTSIPPQATSTIALSGNLDANAPLGSQHTAAVTVYDSLGATHSLQVTFTKQGTNHWRWEVTDPTPVDPTAIQRAGSGTIAFTADGSYDSGSSNTEASAVGATLAAPPPDLQHIIFNPSGNKGAATVVIAPDFTSLVQYAGTTSAEVFDQDGRRAGVLTGLEVGAHGSVTGFYDNGAQQELARVAVADFNNPEGLVAAGNSLHRASANSGAPRYGLPGSGGRGMIAAGFLEMSNVDLASEMTNLIINEKAMAVNVNTVRTKDEMLGELLDLKK